MREENAVSTPMPNEDVQPIKIVICENRLEFARSEAMDGIDRQTLHRMLDQWFDHQVRTAWNLSINASMLQLLDKDRTAGA